MKRTLAKNGCISYDEILPSPTAGQSQTPPEIGPIADAVKHAQKLPHELYRSLTWDRGKEMADHQRFYVGHRHQGVLL